jgi:hypothetical protein
MVVEKVMGKSRVHGDTNWDGISFLWFYGMKGFMCINDKVKGS